MDISIRIGGKAGQGIQSTSSIIAKTFVRYDFFVFINQDTESRIRGGQNFDQIRISNDPVCAVSDKVDILIALDDEAIHQDLGCLDDDGLLLFDGDEIDFPCEDFNHFCVPFARIAKEVGKSKIMINSVATGAAVAIMDFNLQPVLDCLQERFQQKGSETVEYNQKSATAGYDFIQQNFKAKPPFKVPLTKSSRQKMLLTGSQARLWAQWLQA